MSKKKAKPRELSPEDQARIDRHRAQLRAREAQAAMSRTAINKPVRVIADIPADLALCGWGDGPGWLSAPARVWLLYEQDGIVQYLDGPRPLGPPGEPRTGESFPAQFLSSCEDL